MGARILRSSTDGLQSGAHLGTFGGQARDRLDSDHDAGPHEACLHDRAGRLVGSESSRIGFIKVCVVVETGQVNGRRSDILEGRADLGEDQLDVAQNLLRLRRDVRWSQDIAGGCHRNLSGDKHEFTMDDGRAEPGLWRCQLSGLNSLRVSLLRNPGCGPSIMVAATITSDPRCPSAKCGWLGTCGLFGHNFGS